MMDGELPEIFWFLFWIGFVILAFRMAYLGGKSGHDVKMRALDILKSYADQGAEPPPAMLEQLTQQAFQDHPHGNKSHGREGGMLPAFLGFLFMACVCWAVRVWLESSGGPPWQAGAATAAVAFFGFGAFGVLFVGLVTRHK